MIAVSICFVFSNTLKIYIFFCEGRVTRNIILRTVLKKKPALDSSVLVRFFLGEKTSFNIF